MSTNMRKKLGAVQHQFLEAFLAFDARYAGLEISEGLADMLGNPENLNKFVVLSLLGSRHDGIIGRKF